MKNMRTWEFCCSSSYLLCQNAKLKMEVLHCVLAKHTWVAQLWACNAIQGKGMNISFPPRKPLVAFMELLDTAVIILVPPQLVTLLGLGLGCSLLLLVTTVGGPTNIWYGLEPRHFALEVLFSGSSCFFWYIPRQCSNTFKHIYRSYNTSFQVKNARFNLWHLQVKRRKTPAWNSVDYTELGGPNTRQHLIFSVTVKRTISLRINRTKLKEV